MPVRHLARYSDFLGPIMPKKNSTRMTDVAFARFRRMAEGYANARGVNTKFTADAHRAMQTRIETALHRALDIAADTRRGKTVVALDIARARRYLHAYLGDGDAIARQACAETFQGTLPKKLAVRRFKTRHPNARIASSAIRNVQLLYVDLLVAAVGTFAAESATRMRPEDVARIIGTVPLFATADDAAAAV